MTPVLTCEEDTSRRRTYSGTAVVANKSHAFRSKPVYVGGLNDILSETAKLSVTQIVGEDQNNVGSCLWGIVLRY